MAPLSPENISAVESNPLGSSLDPLRPLLLEVNKQTISKLLSTLLGQSAAFELRVGSTSHNVASDLASVFTRIQIGELDRNNFADLVRLVIEKATDIEIWKAVIHLIDHFKRLTPPTSIGQSFDGTPRTYSSASHQGSEQTKNLLKPALRQELWDCTYKDVDGFFEKYFEGKPWAAECDRRYEGMKSAHANGRWTDFPSPPTELAVWRWWSSLQASHFKGAPGIYYTTKGKRELTGTDTERQLDLLVKHRDASSDGQHDWADVRVVGEHQSSRTDPSSKFFQLARYMRDVFVAQPTRRFAHGFLLLESSMELYVFDRSGAYGARTFDIHKEPARFARVMLGYVLMSDEDLGLDTFIERDDGRLFVNLTDASTKKRKRFELETKPMNRQPAIVCRGTCCYRTIDRLNVVKFSWGSDRRLPEADHLRIAKDRGVKGVAQMSGDTIVTSVADLRRSLIFSRKRQFRDPSRILTSSFSQSRSQSSTTRSGIQDLSIQREAKRASVDRGVRPWKKSRSNSQTSKLSQEYKYGGSQEAEIQDTQNWQDGSDKQDRKEWQGTQDTQEAQDTQDTQEVQDTGDAQDTQDTSVQSSFNQRERFRNRVLSCLAISPAGRSLEKWEDVPELLRCFRDAIRAHRSLFIDGKILHRDISLNNIIITDPDTNNGFSGMLIDMDLATSIDESGKNVRSGAQKMTGTLKYMAIEIVELAFRDARHDLDHTYRHDLESFFYVFLDICVNYGLKQSSSRRPDPLIGWYVGSFKTIVAEKRGEMGKGGFAGLILSEFSPNLEILKGLAIALRDALFQQGDIYTGTPLDPLPLYKRMIGAFDDALKEVE